jgi:transposase
LLRVEAGDDLVVMGMPVDRRDELGRTRTQTVNRLHGLLLELFPGGAPKFLSARQARALIATTKPRDIAGKTRRRLAVEMTGELEGTGKKIRAVKKELNELVVARGSTLMDLTGIGPSGAARLLVDVGHIHRFANRDRFASWNGTAPLDASSGEQKRHRALSRREPAHQQGAAHHGGQTAAPAHRGPRLLRPTRRRREDLDGGDALPAPPAVQRRLPAHSRGPATTRNGEPGRALGDDSSIQRDRPDPGRRLFGQATARAHQPRA